MARLLDWLRLTDEDGKLSLTHLACWLAFFCILRRQEVPWEAFGTFVVALASYRVKRWSNDSSTPDDAVQGRVAELEKTVQKLGSPERLAQLQGMFNTRGPGAPR